MVVEDLPKITRNHLRIAMVRLTPKARRATPRGLGDILWTPSTTTQPLPITLGHDNLAPIPNHSRTESIQHRQWAIRQCADSTGPSNEPRCSNREVGDELFDTYGSRNHMSVWNGITLSWSHSLSLILSLATLTLSLSTPSRTSKNPRS